MNNKGFAVSAVLYTLLIAFLLFLGAALAMFSSSNSLISNANSDIVNGNVFSANLAYGLTGELLEQKWYKDSFDDNAEFASVIQIKSKYGIKYWPNNFSVNINGKDVWKYKIEYIESSRKIKIHVLDDTGNETKIEELSGQIFKSGNIEVTYSSNTEAGDGKLIIKDIVSNEEKTYTLHNQK